ncbi:hypothetical protein AZF37_05640 [endosymbiont 'TC1' of Trimyema compressum]|uniref:endolytic transglycosylase MltG n=1 Tax=endosymbiont 'TC1' of Trimyema compressum TaxID=243899 RepID=UPI0007F05DE4|nr:endolytic transglycosylase MltG [endosymbiont 'TC1' of Trimyema compressum]AMP20725.1 hypothetical protein AZF37_05640 [endosymbiont 'TC1' of Trimyema compressum]
METKAGRRSSRGAKKKSGIKKYFVFVLLMLGILIGATFYVYFLPPNVNGEVSIMINEGDSLDTIGTTLMDNDVIKSKQMFILYSRMKGDSADFKSGTFIIKRPISLESLNKQLKEIPAAEQGVKITIPEGYSISQISKPFANSGLMDKDTFLAIADKGDFDYKFLKFAKPENVKYKLEGFLFPDTYYFDKGESPKSMFEKMLNRFDEVVGTQLMSKAQSLGTTPLALVTMASVIEKEAVISKERPIISGVFYNRIKENMKLESCSTVQFALGKEEYKPVVTLEDIKINSPYNTYMYGGLPPGPIASPGKESLEAAFSPETTAYLYFVAKGDGSHIFNTSYEEHLKATEEYVN